MNTDTNWKSLFGQTPSAQSIKTEFQEIPSGTYSVEVEEAKIDETGKYGARVSLTMKITDGDFAKRKVWHNYNLTEKSIPYLKADLLKLGKTTETAADLEAALESLLGAHIEIFLKYKDVKNEATGETKKYMSVYVNNLIDGLPF